MPDETSNLAHLTADIVSAFVGRNTIATADLPALIGVVHGALTGVDRGEATPEARVQKPAVSIRKSMTQDYLISLEDGRPYKSLKRHLRIKYNLSPEDYRAKWGLPKDYPMVAPNYPASRSAFAKALGLGQRGRSAKSRAAKTSRGRGKTT